MLPGLLSVFLLALAVLLYWWGRQPNKKQSQEDQLDPLFSVSETSKSEPKSTLALDVEPEPEKPVNLPPSASLPIERVIIFLRAPAGHQYGGYELLQSLLSCGLRFGEMNIFHRYEQHAEGQTILFSIAAATQTGELNPALLGDFSCAGLSLFLTLNHHIYPSVHFELMLDTARQLAEDLSGNLLDEGQKPLTGEKIQQLRDKIKSFETSQQTMELFV